ncbi:hypothetical protein C817_00741 [Dorea sp. 5-2]|nr:hypothetical protein C817_00741 [Dorea sp. 5-2]
MNLTVYYENRTNVYEFYGICVVGYAELLIINSRAYKLFEKKLGNKCDESLCRIYVLNCIMDDNEIDSIKRRYKLNNLVEGHKMTNTKEIISDIKEETTSYSDDSLFNITSFGTDMTFRELITMYEEGDLEKPEMQRKYVWDKNEASRFIDSILLGLPVPSIFLAKTDDEKRLIVDGYQRIMTVYDYVKRGIFGGDGKSFSLSNSDIINMRWRGKTFQELQPEEQRKIRNSPIHAIVFEQKEPKDDTGMYQIFERINTSGRSLKPQEIRNCVYHGKFNKLLLELNKYEAWRSLFKNPDEDSRMLDVELILRMFAFAYLPTQKERVQKQINLVKYLNIFMKRNGDLDIVSENELQTQFHEILDFFNAVFDGNLFRNGKKNDSGDTIFSKKINPAIVDAVYSATKHVRETKGLDKYRKLNMIERYEKLIGDDLFQDAISKRTTNIEKIKIRMKKATEILYGVLYEW